MFKYNFKYLKYNISEINLGGKKSISSLIFPTALNTVFSAMS